MISKWVMPALLLILVVSGIFGSQIVLASNSDTSVTFTSKERKDFSLPNAFTRPFKSRSNGIYYNLYISLPKNYNLTNKRYPIMYLLDADYSFALAKQISEHLSDGG